ncbi:MAG: hypothetical protein ACRDH2_09710, partial [Anaerolineales bacterium]
MTAESTAAKPYPPPAKTQAQLIYEQHQRSRQRFATGVAASWVVLLLLLIFIFSGIRFNVGPIQVTTIRLDVSFIRQWIPFISGGIGQTIGISFLSIVFATLLALLAALGRLSRLAPVYALS